MSGATRLRLAPWITTLALVLIWESACRLFAIPEFLLPTPSASLMALWQFAGAIWHNAFCTFWVTLLGFAVAVAFGLILGRRCRRLAARLRCPLAAVDRLQQHP